MKTRNWYERLVYDFFFMKSLSQIHVFPPADMAREMKIIGDSDKKREMTIDRFANLAQAEAELIPETFYNELNLGIVIEEELKTNPESDDLIVMGEYERSIIGNQIKIYFGSFKHVLGDAKETVWRQKIKEVLHHEFRHHMESRAGRDDLEREDKEQIRNFWKDHRNRSNDN